MKIGKRIFYDKVSGYPIVDTGQRVGDVLETTVEYDISVYKDLSVRVRDSFDVLELEYNEYAQDFSECSSYRVNPDTKQIEFSYNDNGDDQQEPLYQAPISEQVAANTDYLLDVDFKLLMVEMGI